MGDSMKKNVVESIGLLYLLMLFCCFNFYTVVNKSEVNFVRKETDYGLSYDDTCGAIDSTSVAISDSSSECVEYSERTRAEEIIFDSEEQIREEEVEGEIELLAQLIEAEAGNQDFHGKCLVADVGLNRVDSDRFPDSIEGVIFQTGQFACIDDGGFEKAGWNISEESFQAAYQEYYAKQRIDNNILFFTAGYYNPYCIPMYKYGDHYFGR